MLKSLLTATLGLCAAFCVCADGIHDISAKGKLTVCMMERDLPPFLMSGADGKLAGYDVEIARGIAAELGVQLAIERKAKTFNELVDAVESGKADIAISKLSRTLARARKVIFTEPYLTLHKALLVNRLELAKRRGDTPVPEYVQALRGSVGVLSGSSYQEFAASMFPKAQVKPFADWADIVREVDSGALLCGFRDDLEIKRSMRSLPSASLRLMSVIFRDAEDPIAIAVDAKNIQLRLWIDEYLDERKLRTTADKLLDKYPETAKLQPAAAMQAPPAQQEDRGASPK